MASSLSNLVNNLSKEIYRIKCRYKHDQIQVFFHSIQSKYQCGLRRVCNAQHCLINLSDQWNKKNDMGGEFGALFTDLSKEFVVYLMNF